MIERTLVVLKPDCVQRRLVGQILVRLEQKGLTFIAMKFVRVSPELAKQHYQEHVEKPFYPSLEEFITASPVLAAVVEGPSAFASSPHASASAPVAVAPAVVCVALSSSVRTQV